MITGTAFAQNTNAIRKEADSINREAAFVHGTDPGKAKILAEKALELSRQAGYVKGRVEAYTTLANVFLSSGEYLKAADAYFRIADLAGPENDLETLVEVNGKLTLLFLKVKDLPLAAKYLDLMKKYAAKAGDAHSLGEASIHEAKYLMSSGKAAAALQAAQVALGYIEKTADTTLLVWGYKFIGDVLVGEKQFDRAETYYEMALNLTVPAGYPAETGVLYTRMAHLYQVTNRQDLNLHYNLAALRIREKSGSPFFIASSYMNTGEAYWLLNRKDSARYYIDRALHMATVTDDATLLKAIYEQLYRFAKAEGRYREAFDYYSKGSKYKDRLSQESNRSEIAILEANRAVRVLESENETMNQELLIQKLQIRQNRIQLILFEILFLLFLGLILAADGVMRKNRKRRNELKDLNDRLSQEIRTRIEAEARLRQSEEMHRFLAENTTDVVSLLEPDLTRVYISPSCEKVYGYTAGEILTMKSPLELVDPSWQEPVTNVFEEIYKNRQSARYIYKVKRKDGDLFWAEANITPVVDPVTRQIRHFITVVRDISARMKREEALAENARQKEFLVREIHNRVKNNFAILISLMAMQRDTSADRELGGSLSDLQLRVRTMSLVHEHLYQSQDIRHIAFDQYVASLAEIIAGSFGTGRIRLQTSLEPCMVPIEIALPLGLIVNELMTNAFKYAFPGSRTGMVRISLHPDGEGWYALSVSDDGIGLPVDFDLHKPQSMGSQIIGILVQQIEAKTEVIRTEGTCIKIMFQLILNP